MITTIIFIMIVLFFTDMTLSYFFLKDCRKVTKGDWTLIEANPIIRYFLREFGLGYGILIGSGFVFAILLVIVSITNEHMHYFLAGIYYMMCAFHFLNFMALRRLKNLKGGKKKNG